MANQKLDNHPHSIFRNAADTADEAAEDADLTDWSTSDKLILVIQIGPGGGCNKITDAGVLKLQYSLDGATGWTDVATSNDIEPAACVDVSGLTDGAAVTTNRCANTPASCTNVFETSGQQACGDAVADSFAIGTAENWTECWFGIDPANATGGQTYYFRLYNNTEGTACTNEDLTQAYVPSQLTMASAATQKSVDGAVQLTPASLTKKQIHMRTLAAGIQFVDASLASKQKHIRALAGAVQLTGADLTTQLWTEFLETAGVEFLGTADVEFLTIVAAAEGVTAKSVTGGLQFVPSTTARLYRAKRSVSGQI